MMPAKLFSRPRFLISTKFGSVVKIGGTISAARNSANTLSRPGQRSRANAYAAIALKNTWQTVVIVATTNELRRYSQKLTAAPEPPCACASSIVDSPSTRLNAPSVDSTGSSELGWPGSWVLSDSAVRSIQ